MHLTQHGQKDHLVCDRYVCSELTTAGAVGKTAQKKKYGKIRAQEAGGHPEEDEGELPPNAGLEMRFAQALSGLFCSLEPHASDLEELPPAGAGVHRNCWHDY